MSRIIAFGCSNTVGTSLPDPKKQSWPSILATMLECDYVNLAVEGSSPRYAIYQIQQFEFLETDIVVILWPEITRYCFINDDRSVKHIGIWHYSKDTITTKLYKDLFTNIHALYDYKLFNDYALLFFSNKKIKYFNYFGPYTYIDKSKYQMELLDYGLDGRHPGIESHKYFAEKVYNDLKETK